MRYSYARQRVRPWGCCSGWETPSGASPRTSSPSPAPAPGPTAASMAAMRYQAGGGDPGAPAEAHRDPEEAGPERNGDLWTALSVLLFVGEVRERAERCLAAVLSQKGVRRLEVVLLDRAAGHLPPLRG